MFDGVCQEGQTNERAQSGLLEQLKADSERIAESAENQQPGNVKYAPAYEISERPLRTSGWAQAAHLAFGYVQVRQGKYQVMWPGAAQARASGP